MSSVPALPVQATSGATLRRRRAQEHAWGYLFIGPWLIGFAAFTLGPFLASLWIGFTHWGPHDAPKFVAGHV